MITVPPRRSGRDDDADLLLTLPVDNEALHPKIVCTIRDGLD
jgi:hypothetical protein